MKAQYERVEDLVLSASPVWQSRLGLDHFEIEHVFLDSFMGEDPDDDFKITAVCECRWNYLEAKIKWYLPSAVRHDDQKLEETLVHELCHVLLSAEQGVVANLDFGDDDELTDDDRDALEEADHALVELTTEMVARAFWRAWGTAL